MTDRPASGVYLQFVGDRTDLRMRSWVLVVGDTQYALDVGNGSEGQAFDAAMDVLKPLGLWKRLEWLRPVGGRYDAVFKEARR